MSFNAPYAQLSGIIPVLKPPGMTSHDVVSFVRRCFRGIKAGHTGTLDPAASGVLPILIGNATKAAPFLDDARKCYRAEILFGISTDSQDTTGKLLREDRDFDLSWSDFVNVLNQFKGEILQIPPMVSALHVNGRRLYELARQGVEVARPERKVVIHDISPVKGRTIQERLRFGSRVMFDVSCSKGTYIRTLCNDIGASLKIPACLSFLLRTETAGIDVADTYTMEEIEETASSGSARIILPLEKVLKHLPEIVLDRVQSARIRNGIFPEIAHEKLVELSMRGSFVKFLSEDGRLLAVAEITEEFGVMNLTPRRVFSGD